LWREVSIPFSIEADGPIFRIGRPPDPWQPPDWSLAGPRGTFGNRFDDPDGMYRVLYASSERLGCYLETLARFRTDLTLYADLAGIEGPDDFIPAGRLPASWATARAMGSAEHEGQYADLYSSEWIGVLRQELAADCLKLGIAELDASALQSSTPRLLTQRASRLAFGRGFDGVHYRSKYGHDIVNWALFEPFKLFPKPPALIDLADPALQKALVIHHLRID
jgi:hypothetical protein